MFEQYLNNPNVRALLDTIAYGEGANYNTVFGGGSFSGNQHPHRYVRAGGYNSDAAGRYQFLGSTWNGLQRKYGFADFTPRSQDLGAIALINEKGALSNIVAGDFQGAVRKIKGVWPSLPGGSQQTRTWPQSQSYYNSALAVYAGSSAPSPTYTQPAPSTSPVDYGAVQVVASLDDTRGKAFEIPSGALLAAAIILGSYFLTE